MEQKVPEKTLKSETLTTGQTLLAFAIAQIYDEIAIIFQHKSKGVAEISAIRNLKCPPISRHVMF